MRSLRVLCLGLLVLPAAAHAAFSDVAGTHPNAEAIRYVESQGIVKGYPDGTYGPGKHINRAEFTKIIVGAAFDYEAEQDPSAIGIYNTDDLIFSDLVDGAWYVPYVRKAVQAGVVSGYPDKTFRPEETINAAEASKILVKAFGIDVVEDDIWYKPTITALADRGAIPMSINAFESKLTRGEMAEMVYRLLAKVQTKPSRTYGELAGEATDATFVRGEYKDFTPDVVGNGKKSVLFFHAGWCPYCKAHDEEIARWYQTRNFPNSVYKTDFDTEKELARIYGVTYQHTFVLIDETGAKMSMISAPSDAQLLELLLQE